MVKALTWSVTLYGAETWDDEKIGRQTVRGFKMWIWPMEGDEEDQLDRTQNE